MYMAFGAEGVVTNVGNVYHNLETSELGAVVQSPVSANPGLT